MLQGLNTTLLTVAVYSGQRTMGIPKKSTREVYRLVSICVESIEISPYSLSLEVATP